MTGESEPKGRIDRILAGDPFEAGGHVLQPVARLRGRYGGGGGEDGAGSGAWVRVNPIEVRVKDPGGNEYAVPVTNPTDDAVRNMVRVGLLVAAVSAVLMLIGLVLSKRD